jgi:serine phosphatase RsbU (regulator of sigma subunit)
MARTISSDAYRAAVLKSEWQRTVGILFVIAGFIVLNIIRMPSNWSAMDIRRHVEYIAFWAFWGVYELIMLWLARRAQKRNRPVRTWVAVANTIIECTIPTIALLGQTADKSYLGPYVALSSGVLIIYCFFIILSTLRLSPALCILAGAVSSAGYLLVYVFTLWVAPNNRNRAVFPPETLVVDGILLLGAGLIAAGVAVQIRRHVVAALSEAETRHKLDQIEHDLQIARTIQMGLLPKRPPKVAGYAIAGWSRPAEQTGGDFYDWIELPGGKVLLTIADVAGHGIGPALLVAACRAYFRALAGRGDPLESITAQVDALLAGDIPAGRFITAAVALLEPDEHRLNLYSAGHAPLYLYNAQDGRVEMFEADQPPLGVEPGEGIAAKARVISLQPGDALVLVTDGFFECANSAGEQLGIERLGETIRQHHELGPEQLIGRLQEEVEAFSRGEEQADDLTAVVMKRGES